MEWVDRDEPHHDHEKMCPLGKFSTLKGKWFFFDLKENKGGKFLKVSESWGPGKERHTITIPEEVMGQFREFLDQALKRVQAEREAEKKV